MGFSDYEHEWQSMVRTGGSASRYPIPGYVATSILDTMYSMDQKPDYRTPEQVRVDDQTLIAKLFPNKK